MIKTYMKKIKKAKLFKWIEMDCKSTFLETDNIKKSQWLKACNFFQDLLKHIRNC